MAQKPEKAEIRLTFKLDIVRAYQIKALAKAEKIPLPAYLRRCVLAQAGLAR